MGDLSAHRRLFGLFGALCFSVAIWSSVSFSTKYPKIRLSNFVFFYYFPTHCDEMPFPAIWTRSQRGQLSADYESVEFPGNTFIFLQKRKTQQCSYFRCAHCAKAMKLRSKRGTNKLTVPIVRATIEEGFIDDPDNPLHRHFCIDEKGVDTSTFAAKARYVYNKVKLELLEMPMTPRQAMAYMEAEVMANFPDEATQQEIIRRLPSDKSAKRSFARRSSVAKKNFGGDFLFDDDLGMDEEEEGEGEETGAENGNDSRSIPAEFLKPFSPRPPWICSPGRERLANFFLIYRDPRPNVRPFMMFADIMGINLIHKCADIVCDGNSNFYPRGFAQLYTFHAVHHSIPEEAHLAAFALLPNTASQTYIKLFDILSERIIAEYGTAGIRKNWHFDNQHTAINGCKTIFGEDIVEGNEQSTANFAQLWHEHLRSLFFGTHPDLHRFIRVMREELARASIQAERIFKAPALVKQINLDNLEHIHNYQMKSEYDYMEYLPFSSDISSVLDRRVKRHNLYEDMFPSLYFTANMGQRRRKRKQMMMEQPIDDKGRKHAEEEKRSKMNHQKDEQTEELKNNESVDIENEDVPSTAEDGGRKGGDNEEEGAVMIDDTGKGANAKQLEMTKSGEQSPSDQHQVGRRKRKNTSELENEQELVVDGHFNANTEVIHNGPFNAS